MPAYSPLFPAPCSQPVTQQAHSELKLKSNLMCKSQSWGPSATKYSSTAGGHWFNPWLGN